MARDDLDNGFDSQAGRQLSLNPDIIAPDAVVGEWYNFPLNVRMRVLKGRQIERQLSEIAQNKKYDRHNWIGWDDRDVVTRGFNDESPPYARDHASERKSLVQEIIKTDDEFRGKRKGSFSPAGHAFIDRLKLFSLLELVDMSKKLYLSTTTKKPDFIHKIKFEVEKREFENDRTFNLDTGTAPAPEGTADDLKPIFEEKGLRYTKHKLSVYDNVGKTKWVGDVLEIAPSNPEKVKERQGRQYTIKTGRRSANQAMNSDLINKMWFYSTGQDYNSGWKLFDGFRTVEGRVEPDSTRSDLLMQNGLIPRYKVLSDKIGSIPAGRIDGEKSTPLKATVAEFNETWAASPHTPSTEPKRVQEWFAKNSGEWADKTDGMLSNISDEAKFSLINDLDNLNLEDIPEKASFLRTHHYMPTGHPHLITNYSSLRSLVEGRNERGAPVQDSARYPHTGYQRPVYTTGVTVPYASMTPPEAAAYRQHWENINDRTLGWLHHTKEGRKLWDAQIKIESDKSLIQKADDRTFVEQEFADLGIPIKGRKFTVSAPALLRNRTIKNVVDELIRENRQIIEQNYKTNLDKEELETPLTSALGKHQVNWLLDLGEGVGRGYNPSATLGKGIWKYLNKDNYSKTGGAAPPSLAAKRDLLFEETEIDYYRRQAENYAEDVLIGIPLAKASNDQRSAWEVYDEAEKAGSGTAIVNGEEWPIDELYKRRVRPRIAIDGIDDTAEDEEGEEYRAGIYTFRDMFTGKPIEDVPYAISENTSSFAGSITGYLGYSMVDKLVEDGILPKEYSTEGGVQRIDAPHIPVPPDFDDEDGKALERITLINDIVRQFQSLRGFDNEEGMYRYEEFASDLSAAKIRGTFTTEGGAKYSHILEILYHHLNEGGGLKNSEDAPITNFRYAPTRISENVVEDIREENKRNTSDIEESGGNTDDPSVLDASEEANRRIGEIQGMINAEIQSATANRALNSPTHKDRIRELEAMLEEPKKAALLFIENDASNYLDQNEDFKAYKKKIQQRHYSEILQNAPLNIRATAFRNRIDNLNQMLDAAQTQGDLHDVARSWARAGLIEYKDIVPVDRDGASKLQRVRRRLENTGGVDWAAIDKEYTDHQHSTNSLSNLILGAKENIDALKATGLTTQKGEGEEDFTPEEWESKQEADARLRGMNTLLRGFENKFAQIPSYGSSEHIASLKGHPATAETYSTLDKTPIESIDNSLYAAMKTAPNPVADVLRTGINAWTESRLKGDFLLTNFMQALTATIGEATGIGGDRLRGMNVTKPIDEHHREYGGSWTDWLRPIPLDLPWVNRVFADTSVAETRRKEMGAEGRIYTPDPTVESEVYVGKEPTGVTYEQVLEETKADLTTEMPTYKPPPQRFGPEAETEEET